MRIKTSSKRRVAVWIWKMMRHCQTLCSPSAMPILPLSVYLCSLAPALQLRRDISQTYETKCSRGPTHEGRGHVSEVKISKGASYGRGRKWIRAEDVIEPRCVWKAGERAGTGAKDEGRKTSISAGRLSSERQQAGGQPMSRNGHHQKKESAAV